MQWSDVTTMYCTTVYSMYSGQMAVDFRIYCTEFTLQYSVSYQPIPIKAKNFIFMILRITIFQEFIQLKIIILLLCLPRYKAWPF